MCEMVKILKIHYLYDLSTINYQIQVIKLNIVLLMQYLGASFINLLLVNWDFHNYVLHLDNFVNRNGL